ncbi:MAG: tetratricopeptide repeat protein [Bacteroidales bacterium]|nr:tetratricopeptide repeat protein [Bacteroidales bacterium]
MFRLLHRFFCLLLIATMFLLFASCRQNNAYHYLKNGNALIKLGNYHGAIEQYSQSISIKNDLTEAYYGRAICHSKLNMYEKALQDYNKVLALEPQNLNALFNRAYYIKENTGDYKGAAEDYALFISLNKEGDNAYAYNNMGFAKYKCGRILEGLEDINRSIAMNPQNAYAFRNKGLILMETDSADAACQNLKKAYELGYKNDSDTKTEEIYIKNCK